MADKNPTPRASMTRRQALTRAAALGLTVPALAGLNASGAFAAPRPSANGLSSRFQDVTNLKFYHDKSPWQDYFVEMSALAEEQIQIAWEPIPYSDTTSYQQVINSSISTSDAPDIFTWWSGYRMEDMYKSGNLLDVSDIWQAAIEAGDLPESLSAAFTFDGKQYGVPQSASYWVMYYNKQVFADNGLEVPTTWDEMMSHAETLKGAGVIPFYQTIDGRWPAFIWWEEFLIRQDPQFYVDLCEGRAKYTDPTAVQALEVWKGMIDNEYFTEVDIPMDENVVAMFQAGEVAMIPLGTWFQQMFIAAAMVPGEDYDAFIMPNVNPELGRNVAIVEAGSLCIPASPPNVEASRALAAWWETPEAHSAWTALLGDAGANPKVQHENPVLNNVVTTLSDGSYELIQRYWEATPPAIVENAVDELARFMLNPGEGQSVLEAIQQIADEEWARRETA